MLKNEIQEFIKNEMCIDINHLSLKLTDPSFIQYSSFSESLIEKFVDALGHLNSNELINSIANEYSEIICDSELVSFIDSMRHAFVSFSTGGIKDLFLCQENELWYPKVCLNRPLSPNDIDALSQQIIIYRGCDISEMKSKKFGQSWSTSETVAHEFAFNHYVYQHWFQLRTRCVLKAVIGKENVFYSDQKTHEREVVVNTEKLRDVQILLQHSIPNDFSAKPN